MEISNWFKGFEKGIARLSPEERSAFFSECGKNCVNGGTLSVYKKLYEDAKGNMDVFFQMANELLAGSWLICRMKSINYRGAMRSINKILCKVNPSVSW